MASPAKRNALVSHGEPDYQLLAVVCSLIFMGLLCLFSASYALSYEKHGNEFYFLFRQLRGLAIGSALMFAFARIDYNKLRGYKWFNPNVLLLLAGALLAAVLVYGHFKGLKVRRWFSLGGINVQPSEFAKLALIIFMADYLDKNTSRLSQSWKALVVPLGAAAIILGLIFLGRDLGTPILLFCVVMALLFAAGARKKYIFICFAAAAVLVAGVLVVNMHDYRWERLLSFWAPWDHPTKENYQLRQGLLAVGSGGWFGQGLGASNLKLGYVPESHTDFIFPIICEELGLVFGGIPIVAAFSFLLWRGIKIARQSPNLWGTLVAFGIAFLITEQAFLNIGVCMGLGPTKGLPLPFFSYGGSSTVMFMSAVGILLGISTQRKKQII